jgi:hypothetical protein
LRSKIRGQREARASSSSSSLSSSLPSSRSAATEELAMRACGDDPEMMRTMHALLRGGGLHQLGRELAKGKTTASVVQDEEDDEEEEAPPLM